MLTVRRLPDETFVSFGFLFRPVDDVVVFVCPDDVVGVDLVAKRDDTGWWTSLPEIPSKRSPRHGYRLHVLDGGDGSLVLPKNVVPLKSPVGRVRVTSDDCYAECDGSTRFALRAWRETTRYALQIDTSHYPSFPPWNGSPVFDSSRTFVGMYSSTSFLASSATIVPAASIAANFDRRPVEAFVSGSPKIQFVDDKQRKALGRSDVVAFLNAEDTATSCDVGSLAEIDDAAESGRTIKIDGKELRATSASTRRGRREETAYDVWGTVFVQRKRGGETYCFRGYRAKRVVKVFGAQGTNVTDVVDVAEERGSVFVATSDGDVVFCARKEISDEVWHAGKSESGIVLLSGTPATTGRNDSRREDDGDDDDEEGREDPVALI